MAILTLVVMTIITGVAAVFLLIISSTIGETDPDPHAGIPYLLGAIICIMVAFFIFGQSTVEVINLYDTNQALKDEVIALKKLNNE